MPRPQKGALFQSGIRKQTRKRRGGHVITAKKSPVTKHILGQDIYIPKGCTLTIYKSGGVAVRGFLKDANDRIMKRFFQAKDRGFVQDF